ncbi:hypothetical protein L1987_52685 [Smallanthus sonchifolius]|uniref:Uncharacterized protein n=1 Tax=Smallanthus sonchifolius TaxID=185202 RepID=A0ACB9EUH0_9ASTR|nr:hypothetical protein L1987_52685 [Smallanthus sonchifolius]
MKASLVRVELLSRQASHSSRQNIRKVNYCQERPGNALPLHLQKNPLPECCASQGRLSQSNPAGAIQLPGIFTIILQALNRASFVIDLILNCSPSKHSLAGNTTFTTQKKISIKEKFSKKLSGPSRRKKQSDASLSPQPRVEVLDEKSRIGSYAKNTSEKARKRPNRHTNSLSRRSHSAEEKKPKKVSHIGREKRRPRE